MPDLAEATDAGRRSLQACDPAAMLRCAQALLDAPGQAGSRGVRHAAASLASVALLVSRPGLMRFYRRFMASAVMWHETNLFGIYMSPLIVYAAVTLALTVLARLAMARLGLFRWVWNPPLAQAALYTCILDALLRLL